MDLLLRRHARRGGAAPTGEKRVDGMAAPGAHLDADELNAFAEGALPEAARARYAAHLADCGTCRKVVTGLALSMYSSAKGRSGSPDVSPSRSWWREWIAALLAPPVLRFAVPALALLAVIGVVLVATRSRERSALIAQNEQARVSSHAAAPTAEESSSQTTEEAPEVSRNHEAANATASRESAEPKVHDRRQAAETTATQSSEKELPSKASSNTNITSKQATAPASADANSSAGATPPKQPAGRERDEETARLERSRPMAAAAPPPPTPAPAENRRAENSAAVTEQNAPAAAGRRSADSAAEADTSVSSAAAKSRPSLSARQSAARSRSTGPRKDDEAATAGGAGNASPGVTRSVAGHRFRREGKAWIDVAYNPSQATVNVKRDSEQYRALIADEPGIGGIAEQLGGQVILVWKGRAYRIH